MTTRRPDQLQVMIASMVLLMLLTGLAYWAGSRLSAPAQMAAVDEAYVIYLPIIMRQHPRPLTYGPVGLAGRDRDGLIAADAWYDWRVGPNVDDPSYVRMVYCTTPYHLHQRGIYTDIVTAAAADRGRVSGRTWLVFNEPDNPFPIHVPHRVLPVDEYTAGWQCGRYPITRSIESLMPSGVPFDTTVRGNPRIAAHQYLEVHDLIVSIDPSARVFAGGLLGIYDRYTRWWWTEFIDELRSMGRIDAVDGVHLHAYPIFSTGIVAGCTSNWCVPELMVVLNESYQRYIVDQGLDGLPVWITETGTASWCMPDMIFTRWLNVDPHQWSRIRDGFMVPFSWWFNSDYRWTERHPDIDPNPGYASAFWFIPYAGEISDDPNWQGYRRFWCSFLVDDNGTLTPLGEYWRNQDVRQEPPSRGGMIEAPDA